MIVMDLQSQYAPFLSYVHQVLTGHGSLLFAWPALGSNFIGNFTYYAASPITLLVALFQASMASPLIEIVVVLKAALTAAAMCWFLLSLGPRRRLAAAVFATAYALMSFSVVYSINIMWLDAAYLLPLLC